MNRSEYKYLLSMSDLPAFRARLLPFLDFDHLAHFDGRREYTVRSIYYDTSGLKFYYEKIEGLPVRKKLRVRVYNERHAQSLAFLEIKRKQHSTISKNRVPVPLKEVSPLLLTGDIEKFVKPHRHFPRAGEHARRFLFHMNALHLRRLALVTYEREAYHGKFDSSLRLTLDLNLRCALFPTLNELYREHEMTQCLPGFCIVEIKFANGLPSWLSSILGEFSLQRRALSKYCIGVEKCRARSAIRTTS